MNRRRYIALAILAAIVVAGLLLAGRRGDTVAYQGKSVKTWSELAYSGDPTATTALKTLGSNAVPTLIELLQTKDSLLHKELWSLAPRLPTRWRRIVWRRIGPPNAAATRGAAARALGIIGPEANAAVPFLARALQDPEHEVCWDAATALSRIGKESVPVLIAALQNRDSTRRRAIAYALAEIGPDAEAALPALTQRLQDNDPEVQKAAAYSLSYIRTPLQLTLVKMSRDPAPARRQQALARLATIGPSDGVVTNLMVRALTDPVPEVRLAAVKALGQVSERAQPAVPGLTACLSDQCAAVREWSARTLGSIGAPAGAAVPELRRLAAEDEPAVQAAAKNALAKIEPRAAQ